MNRAIDFYENFFEQSVDEKNDIYSVFIVNNFRFGLFAFEKTQEQHIFGNNCLPSISVDCLEVLKKKIEGLTIVFPIKQIGKNWVAEFIDSEGNQIEITAPVNGA